MRQQLLWAYQKSKGLPTTLSEGTYHFQTAALVKQGWAEIGHTNNTRKRATAGQWILLKQGKRWQQFSPRCQLLSIGYRLQLPTGEALYDEGLPLVIPSAAHPGLEQEANHVLRIMEDHVGSGYLLLKQMVDIRDYLLSQNALRSFLIELASVYHMKGIPPRTIGAAHPHVTRALAIINSTQIKNVGERLSSQILARELGLSSTHLDRLMVAETGHTVHQHIDIYRLRIAQDALIADHDNLKAIAYTLGFTSPSHFHYWFKKRTNLTPLQFRKQGYAA